MILILMGVSGTGKTTLGTMLSKETGWPFLDGDDFHPAANKAKMAAGHPLDDNDRAPWLAILHGKIEEYAQRGEGMIMACSALKAAYRDVLRGELSHDTVRFAILTAPKETIADHLHRRAHEFMNPNLLTSQLATLEDPSEDEAWHISVAGTAQESLEQLNAKLREVGAIA